MTGASGTVGRDNRGHQGLATSLAGRVGQAGEGSSGSRGVSVGEGAGERKLLSPGWAGQGPKEKGAGEGWAGDRSPDSVPSLPLPYFGLK